MIMGDFNTDPDTSQAKCGDRMNQLKDNGWQHSIPISGASYWAIKNVVEGGLTMLSSVGILTFLFQSVSQNQAAMYSQGRNLKRCQITQSC